MSMNVNGNDGIFKKTIGANNNTKGDSLAKAIMLFADNNTAAVSKEKFQNLLEKMKKLPPNELVKFIRSFDKKESIIELICDEIGNDKKSRRKACEDVFEALMSQAKKLGIETDGFSKEIKDELDVQFTGMAKYVNTKKLDSILNAVTQSIENRQDLTEEDLQTIKNTSNADGQRQANEVIENRLENAYSAFGERVGEDGEMTDVKETLVNLKTGEKTEIKYDGQMQQDGIAADIADFAKKHKAELINGIPGLIIALTEDKSKGNFADAIRADLKTANSQLKELKEAGVLGEDTYKAKFKEIFGVEYQYANIVAYQKAEATYINASANYEFEMAFNRTLKTLLSPAPLREEVRYDTPDPSTSMVVTTVTATKEQVFAREFDNLANAIGKNGSEILNKALEEKGVANSTIEEKFEVLKQITQALSKQLHSATLESGGGKEFSEVQAMYNNSYKAAYGVENDIMKRVTDYNVSQEKGAGVVKAGVTIAASLASAFSGIGLVGVAAITAGTTVVTEGVDRGTSGKALNALREDGLGAYIKTVNGDINWEATLKQAVISGGAVLIGGAVAKGVSLVMEGAKPAAQAIAQFGGDVVCDASMEYLTTGKITVEGMIFTVLLSGAGNIVAMKQLSVAADTAASAAASADNATMALATTTQTVDSGLHKTVLSFAEDAGVSEQVVASTISKHPDVVNALASKVAPDGTPLFTNRDIAHILGNSAEMLEKDKAMFMAVLNSDREMNIVALHDNRASAFYQATVDPLDETYYAVRGKSSNQTSASHVKSQAATSSTGSKQISKQALLATETPVDFDVTSLQQWADDMGFTMTIEGKSSKIAIFKDSDGNIVRRITEDRMNIGKVYDDNIGYYKNGKKISGKTKYANEPYSSTYDYDSNGQKINRQKIYPEDSFKTRLFSSEFPTDFDPTYLQKWADDMGLTMTIEGKGSKIAIFNDSEGNMVRRITEDNFRPGKVYDDKIWYFENGREVAGKVKFHFNDFANSYEVDVNGATTNWQNVYPTKAATGSGQASAAERQLGYPINSEAPATSTMQANVPAKSSGKAQKPTFFGKVKNKILGVKTLDDILAKAQKNGAEVTEINPGVYEVKQKSEMRHGDLKNIDYLNGKYDRVTTTTYKDGSTAPTSIKRDYFDSYHRRKKPQTVTTQFNDDGIVHTYKDASSGYKIEYRGYDANGNKLSKDSPNIKIFDENNSLVNEFSGQEIEDALLVKPWSASDEYTQPLLDVKNALSDRGPGEIVPWQVKDAHYFISNGEQYNPINFVREVEPEALQPYKAYTTETPAFKQKIKDYNNYAQTRNLTIEEVSVNGSPVLEFKNAEGQVVRSVDGKSGIETFTEYSGNKVRQSAIIDADGNITKRTMNCYPPFFKEPTASVELDFVNNKSILTDLNGKRERPLRDGFYFFKDYSRGDI